MVGYSCTFVPLLHQYILQDGHCCRMQSWCLDDIDDSLCLPVVYRLPSSTMNASQWGWSFWLGTKLSFFKGVSIVCSRTLPSDCREQPIDLTVACDVWGFPWPSEFYSVAYSVLVGHYCPYYLVTPFRFFSYMCIWVSFYSSRCFRWPLVLVVPPQYLMSFSDSPPCLILLF